MTPNCWKTIWNSIRKKHIQTLFKFTSKFS